MIRLLRPRDRGHDDRDRERACLVDLVNINIILYKFSKENNFFDLTRRFLKRLK